MGRAEGISDDRLRAVIGPIEAIDNDAGLFSESERAALTYAEAMTTADVDDALFARIQQHFDDDAIVELTATIAWENSSARFNRALRVPSQNLDTSR